MSLRILCGIGAASGRDTYLDSLQVVGELRPDSETSLLIDEADLNSVGRATAFRPSSAEQLAINPATVVDPIGPPIGWTIGAALGALGGAAFLLDAIAIAAVAPGATPLVVARIAGVF